MKHHPLEVIHLTNDQSKVVYRDYRVTCTGEVIHHSDGSVSVKPKYSKPAKVLAWGKWRLVSTEEIHLVANCMGVEAFATGISSIEVKKPMNLDLKPFTAKSNLEMKFRFGGCGCNEYSIYLTSTDNQALIRFPDNKPITGKWIRYTHDGQPVYVDSVRQVNIS